VNVITGRRSPFIITGLLVLLAAAAVVVFLTTGAPAPTAAPTPTRAAGAGSEVLPPTATPTTPHLGVDPTPLLTGPLPKSAEATGKLVAGFPTTIVAIPPDSTVLNSAIATQGQHMQATVVGTSAASEGDVQAYFQGAFTQLDLTGAVTPSATGTVANTYSRGTDRITVTTSTASGKTRFSIFALFVAGAG
jgi:hypothetical protein